MKVFWCMHLFLILGVVVKYYENLINIFYDSVVKISTTFKKYDDKIITLFFLIEKIEFKKKRNFIPSQKKIIQVGLLFILVFGMSNSMKGQASYTWNGAGVNGGTGGTDFNTAANWSPAGVPGPGSDALFNLNENTNSTVTLSSNITIGKLTIVDATSIVTTNKQHTLDVGNFTLTVSGDCSVTNNCSGAVVDNGWYELNIGSSGTLSIGGNLTASNGYTSAANASNIIFFDNSGTMTVTGTTIAKSLNLSTASQIQFNVGNFPAITTFGGNLTLDDGTTVTNNKIYLSYTTGTNSNGTFVFKGNFNWGKLGYIDNTAATYIFDALVSQTMTTNASFYSNFNNVIIGSANNPIVNIVTGTSPPDDILGNLTINGSSVLNLGTSQLNRKTNGGTFTMNGTSQLKLGGASTVLNNGTQTLITGSNFPSGFTTNTVAATSTVEYNSLSGVNQTIYATPTYGHLTLTNGTGSGATTKTAGGNLTVAGNLSINPFATFASSTFLHSVGGNWTNNGAFSFNSTGIAAKVIFTGASNTSISGSSPTDFYNLELNKGLNTTSILDITGSGNVSVSGLNLTLTNGLLRVSTGGTFANNSGTNTTINPTSGILVNGGTTSSQFSYINNGLYRVISGIASIGTVSGNSISNAIGSTLDVQGGTLAISGRLVSTGGTYSQSGGTVTLNTVGNASSSIASFDMSPTSNLNITSGTVVFQNPNTATTPFNDINIIAGGNKTISGGTFQMGNASTASGTTFIINSAIPLSNFTVNATNAPNIKLVTNPLIIGNTLTLNGGNIDGATNLKDVIVTNAATAAIVRTSGYINYNLTRALATTGAAYNYPVGLSASANYLAASLTFTNLTLGNLTVKANLNDETNLGTSSIDGTKSVNAYWALSGTAVSTNYSGSVTYNAGITDASVTSAAFKIGKYNGTWAYPTVTPAPSAISLSFTGASGFGNLAVGECIVLAATAGPDQNVCDGATVTLAANSPTLGTGQWSIISGLAGSITTPSSPISTFTGTTNTTYTLRWTINNGTCTNSDDVVVTIGKGIIYANLQSPQSGSICANGTYNVYGQIYVAGLTNPAGAGANIVAELVYSTSNTNPNTWTNWIATSFNTQIGNNDEYLATLSGLSAGTYYYAFRYSLNGCSYKYGGFKIGSNTNGFWDGTNNVSGVLTVSGIPTTAAAGPDQTVCEGTTITLAANSPTVGSGQWSIINGSGGSITTPSSPTSTFTGAINTDYTLRWTTTNGSCTSTSDDVVIRINGINWANTQWPPNASICPTGSVTVFGQIYIAGLTEPAGAGAGIVAQLGYSPVNTNSDPSTWTNWIPAVINPTPLLNNNNDEYMATLSGLPAGTYYYAFRYSLNGCPYKYAGNLNGNWNQINNQTGGFWDGITYISGVLTVNQPNVTISGTTTICSGLSTTLTANGANSYIWSNSLGTSNSITVSPTNSTTYTVTGTDSNNCTKTVTTDVTVNPKPISTLIYHD